MHDNLHSAAIRRKRPTSGQVFLISISLGRKPAILLECVILSLAIMNWLTVAGGVTWARQLGADSSVDWAGSCNLRPTSSPGSLWPGEPVAAASGASLRAGSGIKSICLIELSAGIGKPHFPTHLIELARAAHGHTHNKPPRANLLKLGRLTDDTPRVGNVDTMLSPEIGANRSGQTRAEAAVRSSPGPLDDDVSICIFINRRFADLVGVFLLSVLLSSPFSLLIKPLFNF